MNLKNQKVIFEKRNIYKPDSMSHNKDMINMSNGMNITFIRILVNITRDKILFVCQMLNKIDIIKLIS